MNANIGKVMLAGIGAALALLGLYFGVLTLVSGWDFTLEQFLTYRYFVLALAAGFGIQVGLFVHLKALVQGARNQGVVLATSGTASTAAMVSCCTHYLANIAPIIGAAGLGTLRLSTKSSYSGSGWRSTPPESFTSQPKSFKQPRTMLTV